jgi:methionyl-tRNA formyltransferase
MRLVFAGTPEFAVPTLRALHASEHDIVAVYTQPDRPSGRGQRLRPSAVKQAAFDLDLRLIQVEDFKSDEAVQALGALEADAMVVVAYGLLLSQRVLDLFPAACWNLHASLLPRWRGAAPIARAIEAGDRETGVAVMKMEKGLDTGPVLMQAKLPITALDTAQHLQSRLAELGAVLMVKGIDKIEKLWSEPDSLERALQAQSSHGACYASKLTKAEAQLDFSQHAAVLERRMRAFDPVPGCYSCFIQAINHPNCSSAGEGGLWKPKTCKQACSRCAQTQRAANTSFLAGCSVLAVKAHSLFVVANFSSYLRCSRQAD